jgi:hypothetical protein
MSKEHISVWQLYSIFEMFNIENKFKKVYSSFKYFVDVLIEKNIIHSFFYIC